MEAVALAADRPMASVGFGGGPECAADAAKEAAEEPDVCGRENLSVLLAELQAAAAAVDGQPLELECPPEDDWVILGQNLIADGRLSNGKGPFPSPDRNIPDEWANLAPNDGTCSSG